MSTIENAPVTQVKSNGSLFVDEFWHENTIEKDDFSLFPLIKFDPISLGSIQSASLMTKAVYFWQSLIDSKAQTKEIPSFDLITPDVLEPIKPHSLLLMNSDKGWLVRFLGASLPDCMLAGLAAGHPLSELENVALQHKMEKSLAALQINPAVYGFECGLTASTKDRLNMTFIPFSRGKTDYDFVLCIAEIVQHNFDQAALKNHINIDQQSLKDLRTQYDDLQKNIARMIAKKSGLSHQPLYQALAGALDFYSQAKTDPESLNALLSQQGLKRQKRAPFTPILKLLFGKDYDKTRLTEYAAALSYAWRQGLDGQGFIEMITALPGGIKGCVKAERLERKKQRGSFQTDSLLHAKSVLRRTAAVSLNQLSVQDEFHLVLVKKSSKGSVEIIKPYLSSEPVLETAIKTIAKEIESEAIRSQTAAENAVQAQSVLPPGAGEVS